MASNAADRRSNLLACLMMESECYSQRPDIPRHREAPRVQSVKRLEACFPVTTSDACHCYFVALTTKHFNVARTAEKR